MSPSLLSTLLVAFPIAVLSGMGVGSAGLFLLYLTLVAGYAQPEAQALNLLFFLCSGGASFLLHSRTRHLPSRLILFLVICAIGGALVGTRLVGLLDARLLRRLFGGMLVVTGLPQLLKGRQGKGRGGEEIENPNR